MEKETLPSGFRARAAQLLTWLLGPVQQQRQQQTMQTDRQIFDGNEIWDYSLVDPDNRRPVAGSPMPPLYDARAQSVSGRSYGYDGPDDGRIPRASGPAAGSDAAARIQERFEANRARQEQEDAREHLASGLQARQQRLQAQQRGQGRGQGRGW